MAVLVEAISVIVRVDAINQKYAGGMDGFLAVIPNATFCSDGQLVRVGFMDPADVEEFVRSLEMRGLKFMHDRKTVDIAVVDQMRGPTMQSDWLEFGRLPISESGNKVAACWFFDRPRIAAGVHLPGQSMSLATPRGWSYEESLSASYTFVENEEINERLKFIRREDGMSVYLDLSTGKEVYLSGASE